MSVLGYAQALADAIRSDSRDAMETTIQEFCQAVRGACVTRNRSIFYVQNLLLSVMNGLDTSGLEEDIIYEKEQNLCSLISPETAPVRSGRRIVQILWRAGRTAFTMKKTATAKNRPCWLWIILKKIMGTVRYL